MALTSAAIAAELALITVRIDACFDEEADRHTADRQLTLEDVQRRLHALLDRMEETR